MWATIKRWVMGPTRDEMYSFPQALHGESMLNEFIRLTEAFAEKYKERHVDVSGRILELEAELTHLRDLKSRLELAADKPL